ncbi:YceI family protein [Hymenobacter sp. RP-2-7]|uniref:YceI family protein n=1 Tax=Hymenobacter polaris TaxID=2682546 RepID=A0A7Y0FPG3_9BACT|nr:YceI family protein [Hymenobacter polaris]NML67993.1 YceI family protein [Hymenobacter polaris]
MHCFSLLLLALFGALGQLPAAAQTLFVTRSAQLAFFSSTPLENIDAKSSRAMSALDPKNHTVYFKVDNTSFEFPRKLMQEHFNDNYMESAKYPFSEFTGQYTGAVDTEHDGSYPVLVTGKLKLHGVEKPYQVPGTITVSNHQLAVAASFTIALKDHHIDIPTLVVTKVAEQVQVTVKAVYESKPLASKL